MAQPASNPKIEELRFRVKSDPKSRLFFPLAEELRKIDQLDQAEQVLRTGLTQHPTYLSAWVSLGRVLHESNKHRDAVEALGKALQLDPGNVVAARLMADSYLDLGDKLEAIKKYKLVRALLPADEQIDGIIEKLDLELNAAAPFMAESETPAEPPASPPTEESPFATHDSQAFADAESVIAEEQAVGETTADIEPMRAAHEESPFEEPVADYTAASVTVERPHGIHIEPAPRSAELPAPVPDEEAASDVFAPAEAPPTQIDDVANTLTMADLYVQQGFAEKAREIYEGILQRDPQNREVQDRLEALAPPPAKPALSGGEGRQPLSLGEDGDKGSANPRVEKLERWLAKVKKREEGSVV